MPEATPKTNTMSPNDFLACIVELDEQTRGKDRSVAKLRSVRKRMDEQGCDMKALDLALSLRKLDSGEAEIRLRNALRYARWLEMKVGDQGSLFSDDADQPAEKARAEYSEAQAKAEGYEAGKAGRDGRVHRFQQGSALAQRFYEGWLSGQALLAEQLGTERVEGQTLKPGKKEEKPKTGAVAVAGKPRGRGGRRSSRAEA